ncbi:acetylornithine deacetylase [Oleiphilus sp. HI0125]|uniref:acetylornithine deacetylase n=3 Tax=unclassified Oleiphilus TaxID=2631174 RepID=UPI0007C40469|nr:acetylornithine deacetylase [Oleiphilus sp. HI0125]KZZ57518.1 acetylornithine deacetylase [Oleiphilus sp. HI0125]
MKLHIPKELPSFETLLAKLVGENSISASDSSWDHSNESVIRELEKWLLGLGFRCEVIPVDQQAGKYNLIATLGTGSRGLVLAGHTDTVPYDQARWNSDPFKLSFSEGKYYGLGTCDMKGFFPIIVEALKSMDQAELNEPLIIVATADEESSMAGARLIAQQGELQARAAVIGEPTSIRPIRMHKGILMEAVEFRGCSGHSSNPDLGNSAVNAVHGFLGELFAFRSRLQANYQNANFEVSGPTLNVGAIHGGDSPNRICGHCQMNFDIRPLPGMSVSSLHAEIDALVKQTGYKYKIDVKHRHMVEPVPAFETSRDAELVKACERLTGVPAEAVAFATEAPFLSGMGMETVVMGAGSIDQAHQPNEFLAEQQVGEMAKVLSSLINSYCIAQP